MALMSIRFKGYLLLGTIGGEIADGHTSAMRAAAALSQTAVLQRQSVQGGELRRPMPSRPPS
jgi:hypothetical protein